MIRCSAPPWRSSRETLLWRAAHAPRRRASVTGPRSTGEGAQAGDAQGAEAGQGAPQGQGLANPSGQEAEGRSAAKEDGEPFFTSDEILEMFRAGYSFDEIKQLEQMG